MKICEVRSSSNGQLVLIRWGVGSSSKCQNISGKGTSLCTQRIRKTSILVKGNMTRVMKMGKHQMRKGERKEKTDGEKTTAKGQGEKCRDWCVDNQNREPTSVTGIWYAGSRARQVRQGLEFLSEALKHFFIS